MVILYMVCTFEIFTEKMYELIYFNNPTLKIQKSTYIIPIILN